MLSSDQAAAPALKFQVKQTLFTSALELFAVFRDGRVGLAADMVGQSDNGKISDPLKQFMLDSQKLGFGIAVEVVEWMCALDAKVSQIPMDDRTSLEVQMEFAVASIVYLVSAFASICCNLI